MARFVFVTGILIFAGTIAHQLGLTTWSPAATSQPANSRPVLSKDPALVMQAGSGTSFRDCPSVCPEMVVVPTGVFLMGSPGTEPERENWKEGTETPQIEVTLARPFAVGKFAVTFDEWDACVSSGGCNGYIPSDQGWGRNRRPAINVDWDQARSYIAWLSLLTGRHYRLLSETEREYATRAGTTTPFWWGSSIMSTQANYNSAGEPYEGGGEKGDYPRRTMPVDNYQANPWGLFQVHGNVWEWTEDCWNDNHEGNPGNGQSRLTGECDRRVVRGGAWYDSPRDLRSAFRTGFTVSSQNDMVGFRIARSLDP